VVLGSGTTSTVDVGVRADLPPQATPAKRFAAGVVQGNAAKVKVFNANGQPEFEIPAGTGDVRVVTGDVTGIDTESIMSYCPEGEWSGLLTATDIAGLRAVYGGEGNGIQHDSKVAVRQYDKQYWQGNGSVGPDFKGIRIRRLPATAGSVRFNDQVRFDLGGKFLCAKSGTANSIEWTATYVEAKCSWRVNQVDAQWDGTTVNVNDPLTVSLQLTAAQNGGTAFSANFGPVRFLRVL
jgi:hypothetical protein